MTDKPKAKPKQPGKLRVALRNFFFPAPGASRARRILPYATLGVVSIILLAASISAWEYTNSPVFCGTTCHTMPPEYASYVTSPHARVDCVECHIGGDFFSQRITRKAGDIRHVVSLAFKQYEFPLETHTLRPAPDSCEHCHFPQKFSDDSLREIVYYDSDQDNSRNSIFLAMRTGGGSEREGLGRGIHWHVEAEIYYTATAEQDFEIPYVRVVNQDGTEDVYVALDSDTPVEELEAMEGQRMDCITCHNRITHLILPPDEQVDRALERDQINDNIPYIRAEAVELMSADYDTDAEAAEAISKLPEVYADKYPEYADDYANDLQNAADTLVAIYQDTVFREQQVQWDTHLDNIGHRDFPGCYRCHDGQHINQDNEAIRLECNLCHSIPEVVTPDDIEPQLPLATGSQPESHFSTHWINEHRFDFDGTCAACHDTSNPGGTDNSSFCSNAACHGIEWEYAGLNAPGLTELLGEGDAAEDTAALPEGDLTFDGQIGALFADACAACHTGDNGPAGLALDTYAATMAGGDNGPVIEAGDADASPLVQIQLEDHFANFDSDALQLVIDWINAGAPEN